jgi:solute carrier family 45, member 1/2/4
MTGFSALPTADEAASEGSAQWAGVAKVLGPPWARFPTITVGLVGVQVLWSIEMAYGEQSGKRYPTRTLYNTGCSTASPYLISLGLSRSLMALVFIAGPLSGLIVQPLIGLPHQSPLLHPHNLADCCAGVMADNSKSRFGRRRPYIAVGVALCSMALILLGFTRNFASIVTTWESPAVSITPFRHPISDADQSFRTTL